MESPSTLGMKRDALGMTARGWARSSNGCRYNIKKRATPAMLTATPRISRGRMRCLYMKA